MPFHRLVTPTYFGGLLAGYDYINTPSDPSVGGTGDPANADNKKSGGDNDGTYFVAFNEDATSSNFNRPAKALSENTDILDDLLRTSIPTFATPLDATAPGGGIATVALTGEIYVGKNGTANNQTNRDKIVRVTDQLNADLEVSGTKIVATLIHDGSNNNVVGTQASGFRTNASVTFTPTIPAATTYRVWYGVRNSLANIASVDKGPLFEEQMRNISNIPGELRSLFRQIHSEVSVNQAYDAAFDSTIRSLASAGLNERYRRSTTQPAGFVTGDYNVAGGGRVINRDGGAVEVQAPSIDLAAVQYPDAQHALLRLTSGITPRTLTGLANSNGVGGDIGYIHESDAVMRDFTVEAVRGVYAGPALLDVIPRDIRASTVGGDNVLTFINPTANGSLNPDSVNDTGNRATIQCAAGQHFRLSGNTAIRLGFDLVEVVYSGRAPETYVIDDIISDTRIRVRRFNGSVSSIFPATATNCTIRWLSTSVLIGGTGASDTIPNPPWNGRRFAVFQPAPLSDDFDDVNEEYTLAPAFFSATNTIDDDTAFTALGWGAAHPGLTAYPAIIGKLRGDGSIDCGAVRSTGLGTFATTLAVGTNGTFGGTLGVTGNITGSAGAAITGELSGGRLSLPATCVDLSGSGTIAVSYAAGVGSKHFKIISLPSGTRRFDITLPSGVAEGAHLFFCADIFSSAGGTFVDIFVVDALTGTPSINVAVDPDPEAGAGVTATSSGNSAGWRVDGGGVGPDIVSLEFMRVSTTANNWLVKVYHYNLVHL